MNIESFTLILLNSVELFHRGWHLNEKRFALKNSLHFFFWTEIIEKCDFSYGFFTWCFATHISIHLIVANFEWTRSSFVWSFPPPSCARRTIDNAYHIIDNSIQHFCCWCCCCCSFSWAIVFGSCLVRVISFIFTMLEYLFCFLKNRKLEKFSQQILFRTSILLSIHNEKKNWRKKKITVDAKYFFLCVPYSLVLFFSSILLIVFPRLLFIIITHVRRS